MATKSNANTEKEYAMVVGIDVANSTLKVYTDSGKSFTYRNTVRKVNDAGFVFSFNKEFKRFGYNNEIYEIGFMTETGSGGRGQQRYRTDDFKIEALIALAQVCNPGEQEKIKIVTGVPSDLAKNDDVLKQLKDILMGEHTLKTITNKSTKSVSFEVVEVEVLAQPFGTLYDFMVNDKGQLEYPNLVQKNMLVVDIGWATLDLAILEQGSVRSTFGFEMGIADYIAEIQEKVNTDIPDAKIYTLNAHEFDMALLESTKVETPFGKYDLSKYVAEQKKTQAKRIYQKVMSLGLDFSQFYKIILTGGGALLLENEFKDLFADPRLVIKPDSQIANVRGFAKFGKFN